MPRLWLGDRRGNLLDWTTQRWVQATGRLVDLREHPWLVGPIGDTHRIGPDWFERQAAADGLHVRAPSPDSGLMASFAELAGPGFDPARVHASVRDFYQHTSAYALDVWSEWSPAFRPFGGLLAALFSRRLEQLNVPLSPLSTTRGMASRVVELEDPATRKVRHTVWLRENRGSGLTVYVGVYSVARVPGHPGPCVKVVFPLPNGNATVIMKPSVVDGAALQLESSGRALGDPGFYFTVRRDADHAWVRYVRSFRETIRVYAEAPGELRTDHRFTLWSRTFLRLHYRLRQEAAVARPVLRTYASQTTEELLALEGDYRIDSLVEIFAEALQRKAEREQLGEEERSVLAIAALDREVRLGGFARFFRSRSHRFADCVEAALDAIDCPETAQITREALAALHLPGAPTAATVAAAIAREDWRRDVLLEACDERYRASRAKIAERLFAWIRANRVLIRVPGDLRRGASRNP